MTKYLIPVNFFLAVFAAVLLFFAVRVWFSPERMNGKGHFEDRAGDKETKLHLKKRHPSLDSFNIIPEKDLFRRDRKEWNPPSRPSTGSAASGTVTIAPPDLKLQGIIFSKGSGKYVFFAGSQAITTPKRVITEVREISGVKKTITREVGGTSSRKLAGKKYFRLNDRIGGYYTLSEIHRDRVVLTTDHGERMELKLEIKKSAKKPTPKKKEKPARKKPEPKPKISGS